MIDHKVITFLKVVDLESFSKAAEELGLTQPAVSQQIRQLEAELGVQLMIRKRGTFTLTPQGEIVLRYASSLNKTYHGIWNALENADRKTRHVVIPITEIAVNHPIIDVIAQYSIETPGMKISMYESTKEQVFESILAGTSDWGIADSCAEMDNFGTVTLQAERLVCVMSPDHPLASAAEIGLEDILRETAILPPPKYSSTKLFVANLRRIGHDTADMNIRFETSNIGAIKRFVHANLGISVLSENSCKEEAENGRLVVKPIMNMNLVAPICLVYSQGNQSLDIMQEVIRRYNKLCQLSASVM